MTTLATILAVASKEWKVLWRDHTIVAAIVLQPMILTAIFGYAVRSEVHDAHWVVYDADRTATSRRLVDELVATRKLAPPRPATSYAATERLLHHGDGAVALVIPRDFTRALARGERASAQLLLNGADPLVALRLSAVVREVASRFRPDAVQRTDDTRRPPGDPEIDLRRTIRFNPTLADLVFFVPTIPAIFFTQFFFGLACFSIVGERERGTYEHLLALPLEPMAVLIGKVLPYFVVAYVWMLTYYAAADIVFGVTVRGSAGLLLFATLVFLLTSYAIAVLFSTVARNTHQAVYLTVFSVLPSTVISGFMVPTSTMPRAIQIAALGLPATHYVTILRAVVVRGAHLADVATPLVAMTVILTVVVACVLVFYPRRLDR
jgi:ABC-type multidrug transport system permease subunit